MPFRRPIEAGGDHLSESAHLHIRDFLRPLVDQENHETAFRVVRHDAFGDRLKHGRLTGLRRRNDHRPLALTEGTEQVDHTVGVVRLTRDLTITRQNELLARVYRAETVEVGPSQCLIRGLRVDERQVREGRTLATVGRPANTPCEFIAGPKSEFLNDLRSDVDVLVAGRVTRLTLADEAGATTQHFQDPEVLDRGVVRTR